MFDSKKTNRSVSLFFLGIIDNKASESFPSHPIKLLKMLSVLVESKEIMQKSFLLLLAVSNNKILDAVIRVVARNGMTSCPRHFLGKVL